MEHWEEARQKTLVEKETNLKWNAGSCIFSKLAFQILPH